MKRSTVVLLTVAVLMLVAAIFVLSIIYSGMYNVAASAGHSATVAWITETTMERSVQQRAASLQVPPEIDLGSRALVEEAGKPYSEMCQMCHGAPGAEPAEWVVLTPSPPDLSEEASEWSDAELYWIIKHGVKMTGMPAFGPSHDEKQIWALVAFVRHLPDMSPQEYEMITASPSSGEQSH